MKNKKQSLDDLKNLSLAYSTDPNYKIESDETDETTISKNLQKIRVRLDTKSRAGKSVTMITGLEESDQTLEDLCKKFKQKCGVGGSAKDGVIIIQGDHVQKIIADLINMGYKDTKKSGG